MGGVIGRNAVRSGHGGFRHPRAMVVVAMLAIGGAIAPAATASVVRAAYVYDHMDVSHVDVLSTNGFNRMILRLAGDSLGTGGAPNLRAWVGRGLAAGVEPVPDFRLEAVDRLRVLPTTRRYTWAGSQTSDELGCPLDSLFWRSALLDHAEEVLRAVPDVGRIAVDLEFTVGPQHYDAGPCRCDECIAEYTGSKLSEVGARSAWRLSGLLMYQEARLGRILGSLLGEFAARHPGVEIGVLDLDLDSFVHRALARALLSAGVPTTDYCERSYTNAGTSLVGARARLRALGHKTTPMIGGVWLKQFPPGALSPALTSILDRAEGYFVFTTYSLDHPSTLDGPYELRGHPTEYWRVLAEVNRRP